MSFHNIKESPTEFTGGNIISRFIDGLAFRYYWATEGLNEKDLAYKPSDSGMSTLETLEHMVWLSEMIKNSMTGGVSDRLINRDIKGTPFNKLRNTVLDNLELSSNLAREKSTSELEKSRVVIKSNNKEYSTSLWNLMNGPIADALYHTGQIVSFRRSSGNPVTKGINHFASKGPA